MDDAASVTSSGGTGAKGEQAHCRATDDSGRNRRDAQPGRLLSERYERLP